MSEKKNLPDWHYKLSAICLESKISLLDEIKIRTLIEEVTNKPGTEEKSKEKTEVRILIGVKNEHVVMDFGKEISWVGMTADEALSIGKLLFEKADAIKFGD